MQKGFTLIELIIVLAIISILAAIVMVSFRSAREKAASQIDTSKIQTQLHN